MTSALTGRSARSAAPRRALARAARGAALDLDEAATLLSARDGALVELCTIARGIRDLGLREAGREGTVTYSPKVFIPVTRLCRDRCHYCTFVSTPGQLAAKNHTPYLSPDEILQIARDGAAAGCLEALFTLGDRPEERWPHARTWLEQHGYDSTLSYVRAMSIRVLEETGLLPHLNPGVMSWEELTRLKPVAPSMGMMLETTARRLFEEKGQPHFASPDKDPSVRIRVLEDAGRVGVPFTTGLLVGIGENLTERAETIIAIRRVARLFGGVQEVIVQNFRAKPDTAMCGVPDTELDEYRAAIAVSRILLGPKARVQAPPNLVDLAECRLLLDAGIDDFGGISPVTPDHVNPERPWPAVELLGGVAADAGMTLKPRLTVHPEYIQGAESWIDPRVRAHVAALAGPDGLARPDARATGLPWQEPDQALVAAGRTDLYAGIDIEGRSADRRDDFDTVYGDWNVLAGEYRAGPRRTPALRSVGGAALAAAQANPGELSLPHALTLIQAEGELLTEICSYADHLRGEAVGDEVTYVINRNINFTNVCYVGCRFCAFAQRRTDTDAYSLDFDQVADRAAEAAALGATEVCMQGGIDPNLPGSAYADLVRAVKGRVPHMHVHAFSPMEIVNGSNRTGMTPAAFLSMLRDAGLDSIPGTAAEILDDDIRWVLTKGKLPARTWIDVVMAAHKVGLRSSSTMMYGHVDHPRHWVDHLRTLAKIQDETGGFTEFVPLPFVHSNAPIYLAGIARPGPTHRDNLAVHAMARILLHGRIQNIQTSWVKLGVEGTRAMLMAGANDLGGTLMEETISRMAGSEHGSAKTVADLSAIAEAIGRPVRQRTTLYGIPGDPDSAPAD